MNIFRLIELVQQGANLLGVIANVVDDVKGTLSEEDSAILEQKLAEIAKANDEAHARVSAKLQALKNSGS
jgi:uncharacterized membrane protein YgcG